MREIVQINVGNCGVKIGYKYWEMIGQEHMIDNDGRYNGEQEIDMLNTHICYNQVAENKYVPRCIFVDLDPRTNDEVLSGPLGRHFNQDNFISGISGAGGNWAKGFYTDGNDLSDLISDKIRREMEACDLLQSFQFNHSVLGGTGSGLGVKLIDMCREEFPDRIIEACSIFPSFNFYDSFVEPYNAVLSIHHMVENADFVNVIHNKLLNKFRNY